MRFVRGFLINFLFALFKYLFHDVLERILYVDADERTILKLLSTILCNDKIFALTFMNNYMAVKEVQNHLNFNSRCNSKKQ